MILVLTLGIVATTGDSSSVSKLTGRAWLMLGLSALATAVSWVAYFHALATGPATPVTAIDRSSLIVTMVLAVAFFGEPFSIKTMVGVILVVIGAVLASVRRSSWQGCKLRHGSVSGRCDARQPRTSSGRDSSLSTVTASNVTAAKSATAGPKRPGEWWLDSPRGTLAGGRAHAPLAQGLWPGQ